MIAFYAFSRGQLFVKAKLLIPDTKCKSDYLTKKSCKQCRNFLLRTIKTQESPLTTHNSLVYQIRMQSAFNLIQSEPSGFALLHLGIHLARAGLTANTDESFFLQRVLRKVIF